jgi:hypothetical protein
LKVWNSLYFYAKASPGEVEEVNKIIAWDKETKEKEKKTK